MECLSFTCCRNNYFMKSVESGNSQAFYQWNLLKSFQLESSCTIKTPLLALLNPPPLTIWSHLSWRRSRISASLGSVQHWQKLHFRQVTVIWIWHNTESETGFLPQMIKCSRNLLRKTRALIVPFTNYFSILISIADYTPRLILENLLKRWSRHSTIHVG